MDPVAGLGGISKVYLDFDFVQTEFLTVKYTFLESLLELLIIFPIVFGVVLAFHSIICLLTFYTDFARLIQQKYFANIEID